MYLKRSVVKFRSWCTVTNLIFLYFFPQTNVEILQILSDEDDTTEAGAGENVKLKVRGVEEEVY